MKKQRVDVTRRDSRPAFIQISQSRDRPEKIFISSPLSAELTRDETISLINALKASAAQMWGDSDSND